MIFSSRMIPGNERPIHEMQNTFAMRGVEVISAEDHDVHVSGHPARDELGAIFPDLFTMPAGRTFGQRARSLARQRDLPPSLHDLRAA